jgi:small GTP-binding protein
MIVKKVVLLGSTNVGKSTYIEYVINKEFNPIYTPTDSTLKKSLTCKLRSYEIKFDIYELSGNNEDISIFENLCENADAYIMMFDISSLYSLMTLMEYIAILIKNQQYNKPIILCANKTDIQKNEIKTETIFVVKKFLKKITQHCKYIDMSVLESHNCSEPMFSLVEYFKNQL